MKPEAHWSKRAAISFILVSMSWPPHLSVHETDARAPRAERRKNKGPLAIEGLY